MSLLDIVHPAAKTLVDISLAQDAEVGDGTTTVVLLAGEILKVSKTFIEDGIHPQVIVKVSGFGGGGGGGGGSGGSSGKGCGLGRGKHIPSRCFRVWGRAVLLLCPVWLGALPLRLFPVDPMVARGA
jgi:hypothetical protein